MKKYNVRIKIELTHKVEANSAREAEEIARDLGEVHANLYRSTEWKAQRVLRW